MSIFILFYPLLDQEKEERERKKEKRWNFDQQMFNVLTTNITVCIWTHKWTQCGAMCTIQSTLIRNGPESASLMITSVLSFSLFSSRELQGSSRTCNNTGHRTSATTLMTQQLISKVQPLSIVESERERERVSE